MARTHHYHLHKFSDIVLGNQDTINRRERRNFFIPNDADKIIHAILTHAGVVLIERPIIARTELIIDGRIVQAHKDLPMGYKLARFDIGKYQPVYKYGFTISLFSQSNAEGGLSTIEGKSLRAYAKSGSSK